MTLELSVAAKDTTFSVRQFAIREAMSAPFEVKVVAVSERSDVDLESIVGKDAALRASAAVQNPLIPNAGSRKWTGICSEMERLRAERSGLSTYALTIVPTLWLLDQRRNCRIFYTTTLLEIVCKILAEWGIEPEVNVDATRYATFEYRVQYGETDLMFVSRLLEEAGIVYYFLFNDGVTQLVLNDRPHGNEPRPGGALKWFDSPNTDAMHEFVTAVRVGHKVRPGKCTVRDFDFRGLPTFNLLGRAQVGEAPEDGYEHFFYQPGAFVDDKGPTRPDERQANAEAEERLLALRSSKRQITFRTSAIGLAPGVVLTIAGHPQSDLASDKSLLMLGCQIEGEYSGDWKITGMAVVTDVSYRPPRSTPKPTIYGVQSAIVVGELDEEICTDGYGRVRAQFHWDRAGSRDERSSCWMRVSQGWAGSGFGLFTIPRVGQEVLVGFFDGDPDQPVIVGRVHNSKQTVPHNLPEHKTVSTWKSSSTPISGGFNEIKFDDKNGKELVYVRAERDLEKFVKRDESIRVEHDRSAVIHRIDARQVGERYSVTIQKPDEVGEPTTAMQMTEKNILLTTGQASISLNGPNISLSADGEIVLRAKGQITIKSDDGDIVIHGSMVRIN